jgi:hypothetical protein
MTRARRFLISGFLLLAGTAVAQIYLNDLPVAHPAIRYMQSPTEDPVAHLIRDIESGKTKLDARADGQGYLPSLLEHLGIRADSQALVFSKTSFQAPKISPRNPRAIYFGDDVAVGWVRGGDGIELAATDPRQGVIFYTLKTPKSGEPAFQRGEVCLKCHQGAATAGVPGMFIGSVFPSASGEPHRAGAIITDHRTAFADRWGGWYVNAMHGEQQDRANAVAPDPAEPETLDTAGKQNLTTLAEMFNPAGYLTRISDIVALMTFEHQTQMANLMTRVGWEARIPETDPTQLRSDIDAVVAYMLFADEAPLREAIQGVSTFTKTFPLKGPFDRKGRSLRDFDLQTRLFKYPLSYMVYGAQFDALPGPVRERIYQRLFDVLTGKDPGRTFARLSSDDRRSIIAILRDTKPGLPGYWRETAAP